ncbi:speckle-type POZ protein-like [Belonocnema kinseyi]|uniref:speckle-type POZ protein-like n=1 Tax=Belonocnema kinseyi TaxID=2817044 RepID=UPI00143CC13C|nr:speckle-type POZ protein-like [Belonocnema kinseyi]
MDLSRCLRLSPAFPQSQEPANKAYFTWMLPPSTLFQRDWISSKFSFGGFDWALLKVHLIKNHQRRIFLPFLLVNLKTRNTPVNLEVTIYILFSDNSTEMISKWLKVEGKVRKGEKFQFLFPEVFEVYCRRLYSEKPIKILCEFKSQFSAISKNLANPKAKNSLKFCQCFANRKKTCVKLNTMYEQFMYNVYPCDVEFLLGEKRYPAHRSVLIENSPVFKKMFAHEMQKNILQTIKIMDMDADVLEELIQFMYRRKVGNFETLAAELFIAADNICKMADRYNASNLRKHCLCVMLANYNEIVNLDDFEKVDKSILVQLCREIGSKLQKFEFSFKTAS